MTIRWTSLRMESWLFFLFNLGFCVRLLTLGICKILLIIPYKKKVFFISYLCIIGYLNAPVATCCILLLLSCSLRRDVRSCMVNATNNSYGNYFTRYICTNDVHVATRILYTAQIMSHKKYNT
jgi:hypothetical protein